MSLKRTSLPQGRKVPPSPPICQPIVGHPFVKERPRDLSILTGIGRHYHAATRRQSLGSKGEKGFFSSSRARLGNAAPREALRFSRSIIARESFSVPRYARAHMRGFDADPSEPRRIHFSARHRLLDSKRISSRISFCLFLPFLPTRRSYRGSRASKSQSDVPRQTFVFGR